jgi:conjugal transfer ATP-binding protein TraC
VPPYDENQAINRQIIAPNTKILVKDTEFVVDDKHWISLVPQSLQTYASIGDFGEKLGDYISKRPEINQFQDNFIVTLSVCKLPKSNTNMVKRNHQIISTQQWRRDIFRKFAAAQDESVEILDKIENGKETLYAMDLNVLVSGNSEEDVKRNSQIIKSYWNKGGEYLAIKLEEAVGIHHLNFLASIPMGINEEYLFDTTRKYRSMFPKQIAQYAPLEADFKGAGQNFPLITRRCQFANFDLFASNKSFNGYVVATSGAGKSVFLQTIAVNSYARGDRVFVLDYDNSFEGLCQAVDAQYISLNPQNPISFNPFSEMNTLEELKDDLAYLSDFIYMLGGNKNQVKAEEEEKLVKSRIQEILIDLYSELGNKMEITHIRNRLRQENDSRFKDFASQLGVFCRDGIYGRFFEGDNEFNIKKEFIAVEFKEMSEHPDIRDPIIMMLVYHINQMMYSSADRKSRIQIILDEAHRFLGKNPRMDDFIEQAYRRARKYNGSIILATQGFDDIYDPKSGGLSAAGKVIIANSPWKFFLTQTETSINMLIKSGVFNLDEIDKQVLKSIHTTKGEYSEIFIITPDEHKVPNRLIMNRFFYYVTTTDPKDKEKIASYKAQGLNHIEAIKKIVKEENA